MSTVVRKPTNRDWWKKEIEALNPCYGGWEYIRRFDELIHAVDHAKAQEKGYFYWLCSRISKAHTVKGLGRSWSWSEFLSDKQHLFPEVQDLPCDCHDGDTDE